MPSVDFNSYPTVQSDVSDIGHSCMNTPHTPGGTSTLRIPAGMETVLLRRHQGVRGPCQCQADSAVHVRPSFFSYGSKKFTTASGTIRTAASQEAI